MKKIIFNNTETGEPAEFYVLEQTRIGGFSYILVTDSDQDDEDAQAWILKDLSADTDSEALYEFVEDETELEAVGRIFAEMLEDTDLEV